MRSTSMPSFVLSYTHSAITACSRIVISNYFLSHGFCTFYTFCIDSILLVFKIKFFFDKCQFSMDFIVVSLLAVIVTAPIPVKYLCLVTLAELVDKISG